MISDRLLTAVTCTSDECAGLGVRLHRQADTGESLLLHCEVCGRTYKLVEGYVDLMPPSDQSPTAHTSLYVAHEEEFADTLDYRAISLPLLGAGVRQRAIRRMLSLSRDDSLIELGCGNGKFLFWNRKQAGWVVGVDPAPLFAEDVLRSVDLCRADARRLPFADGTFTAAMSVDVLEHLPLDGVLTYLGEARRVLSPDGRLFLFSNTREGSRLDFVVRGARILSKRLGDMGLIDNKRDNLRKSDHVKAIATYDALEDVLAKAGFRVEKVIFWNGLFQSLIENLLVKIGEALLRKRGRARGEVAGNVTGSDVVRSSVRSVLIRRGLEYRLLRLLTELMWLDLVLFGSWRAGPYFLLARREERR